MNFVHTGHAPKPGGHYSQAVVHGGLVWVSGQLPFDPATGEPRTQASVEEQTRLVLENVAAILRAAGSGPEHILKMTIYVSDISLWGRVNATYAEFFGEHKPARAVVPSRELHHGALLEADAVAAVAP